MPIPGRIAPAGGGTIFHPDPPYPSIIFRTIELSLFRWEAPIFRRIPQ